MMGTSALQDFSRSLHFVCRIGPGPWCFPNAEASGYEGYAIAVSNAHLQVYPQENNRYETRDALACVAA
jgi:hypothetical protein